MSETSAEGKILRYDVFKAIKSGEPFDLVWISANRKRGTGGDILRAESWLVVSSDSGNSGNSENGPRADHGGAAGTDTRDPNHPDNGTVNIYNPANSSVHIHKVHVDLIQFFNNKRVIN